jgi:hypothetical protein
MRLIAFLLAGWTAWNAKSTKCLSADSLFWLTSTTSQRNNCYAPPFQIVPRP